MADVNDVILNKNILIDDSFVLLDNDEWDYLEYNDDIIIEKTDNSMGKYYYKSMNDNYLICSNLKFNTNNKKYKYIPFRFSKSNILHIYRQSKIHCNLDLIEMNNKISSLERENKILKKKINEIIKILKDSNSSICS
jgi:hypothetical protein